MNSPLSVIASGTGDRNTGTGKSYKARRLGAWVASFAAVLACTQTDLLAGDCTKDSTGRVPLPDLGATLYQGQQGGLYPEGSNFMPPAHQEAGTAIAATMEPLNSQGQPSATGVIGIATVGMSNTREESLAFIDLADAADRNPAVRIANLAQDGADSTAMVSSNLYWMTTVPDKLQEYNLSREQVQVVWIKSAQAFPVPNFPGHAENLQGELETIVQRLLTEFPNLKMVFLESRTYGNYTTIDLSPEPFAYETGFAIKWLIEDQINDKASLNFDPAQGPVEAPWLGWGPYLWADGVIPGSDGVQWNCDDFEADGTHPSPSGEQKVASRLLDFFLSSPVTATWFRSDDNPYCGDTGFANLYGSGVGGSLGVPRIGTSDRPSLETSYSIRAYGAVADSPGAFFLGPEAFGEGQVRLDGGWLLSNFTFVWPANTDGSGVANLPQFGASPNPALCGLSMFVQYAVVDPSVASGRLALSPGIEIGLGH